VITQNINIKVGLKNL